MLMLVIHCLVVHEKQELRDVLELTIKTMSDDA